MLPKSSGTRRHVLFGWCRSVDWKISKHVTWDLIFLHNNFIRNDFFLFCMLISNVHKSVIVINSIDTRFPRNVFEVVCVFCFLSGLKSLAFDQRRTFPSSQRALFPFLRASSLTWASEASCARTGERRRSREGPRKGELVTITHKFSFVLPSDEGKYHWLKNDVPEIKVDW